MSKAKPYKAFGEMSKSFFSNFTKITDAAKKKQKELDKYK